MKNADLDSANSSCILSAEWHSDPDHFVGGLCVVEDKIQPYLLNSTI